MSGPAEPSRMPISLGSLLWIAVIVWLVMPSPRPIERSVDKLRKELAELRREVSQLRTALAESTAAQPTSHERRVDDESAQADADQARNISAAHANASQEAAPDDAAAVESPSGASAPHAQVDLDVEREE